MSESKHCPFQGLPPSPEPGAEAEQTRYSSRSRDEGELVGEPEKQAEPPCLSPWLVALAGQFLGDEFPKALEVLAVEFNVIVPGPVHPQRLHSLGAALEERQAVGEVDDFVLRTVDDEDRRGDFGDLLDAAKRVDGEERRRVSTGNETFPLLLPPKHPLGEGPGNAL